MLGSDDDTNLLFISLPNEQISTNHSKPNSSQHPEYLLTLDGVLDQNFDVTDYGKAFSESAEWTRLRLLNGQD